MKRYNITKKYKRIMRFENNTNNEPSITTIVQGSGTKDGHIIEPSNEFVPHKDEQVNVLDVSYVMNNIQNTHNKTTKYKYNDCGYEWEVTIVEECVDNGTGKCDCGRVMTHTCNFEEIPQTLTSEEAMTYCRISKFVCSECGKEDESRTIKIPHDPYREAIPDDIFDKIGCNKCSHVLVPSIGFESDWSWEYDGVKFFLKAIGD